MKFFPFDRWNWRTRTLVPVVLIHVAAFVSFYAVTYQVVDHELTGAHQRSAGRMLDQLERELILVGPRSVPVFMLDGISRMHGGVGIVFFDETATVKASSSRVVADEAAARLALEFSKAETIWTFQEGRPDVLVTTRRWQTGAIQIVDDLRGELSGARRRIGLATGLIVALWGLLAFGTSRLRRLVIGRPIERIEQAAARAGAIRPGEPSDLDSLADRLHEAIWGLLERQRERDAHVERHMARAEQLATLGELAAGLTHEIRSPLAGISAALEVVRDEEKERDPARAQLFDQMCGELARVMGTVDGLLRLARPEPPRRTDVDLGRLVRQVVSLFEPRARKKKIRLSLDEGEDMPILPLDANLMSQVILNLLTNAMQALPEGGSIRVLVSPFPRRDGVLVAVEDDGPGIPAAELERIWEPFFTTKADGTGLGLPITRSIVEQHGGTISIESAPDRGTKVLLLFPAGEGPAKD